MIYASYHSRLEMSFCMDEFLKPPIKDDIDFDLDDFKPSKIPKEPKEAKETKSNLNSERNSLELIESKDADVSDTAVNAKADVTNKTADENVEKDDAELSTDPPRNENIGKFGENLDDKSVEPDAKPKFYISKDVPEDKENEESAIENDFERFCSFVNISTNGEINSRFNGNNHQENQSNENSDRKTVNQSGKLNSTNQNLVTKNRKSEVSASSVDLRKRNTSGGKRDKSPSVIRRSATTQLTDNSDPLSSYQISKDESIFQSSSAITFQEQLVTHR